MNISVTLYRHKLHIAHQREELASHHRHTDLQAEILALKHERNRPKQISPRKIALFANGQRHYLSLADIIYCQADGNYSSVFYRSWDIARKAYSIASILVSKSLKSLTSLLSSDDFIRCHQSFLTNRNYVKAYLPHRGLVLGLANNICVPVSRRNKKMVSELI